MNTLGVNALRLLKSSFHHSFLNAMLLHIQLYFYYLEIVSIVSIAWRIPGTGEPGGLLSMGLTDLDTTEVT